MMKKLHPMFNVVKLSTAPDDLIPRRKPRSLPPPVVIDREEEWKVEEILDSHWHRRRFQFLVKLKGFEREHNFWGSRQLYYIKHGMEFLHHVW